MVLSYGMYFEFSMQSFKHVVEHCNIKLNFY